MKAHGDGWVLTVALMEGVDLASMESTGLSDPYVVFTCNGRTRSSSVKLQTRDPQWNGESFHLGIHLQLRFLLISLHLHWILFWFFDMQRY